MSASREGLAAFVFFSALGAARLAPSVTFGDAGELAACASALGIAHSPGYPLYSIFGKAWGTLMPLGSWAYRMNLLSAACGAAALAVLLAALRAAGHAAGPRWAAALLLGLSPTWLYETAVTEVFAPHLLILALMLYCCSGAASLVSGRLAAALGLLFGLGMANHHTLALLVPALALQAALERPGAARFARAAAIFGAAAALGLALYLYLPIRSARTPPLDWGHPVDWPRFLRVFLRKDYGSLSLTVEGSAGGWAQRLAQLPRWLAFSREELGTGALALAALGAACAGRRALTLGAAFLFGPGFLLLGNPPFDAQTTGALDRFYLASWLPLSFSAAAGASWLGARWAPAPWLAVVLAAAQGYSSRSGWWARSDFAGVDYGRSTLRSLPPGAAFFMDGGDDTFYTLAYLTIAEGRRRDLALHDRGGLVFPSAYGPEFRRLARAAKEPARQAVEAGLAAQGRLYYSTLNEGLLPGYSLRPEGLVRRAEKDPRPPEDALWQVYPRRWSAGLMERRYRDRQLPAFYPFMEAEAARARRELRPALLGYMTAVDWAPDALWVKPSVGAALAQLGYQATLAGDWPAGAAIYGYARRLDPSNPDFLLGAGLAEERSGRPAAAEAAYRQALRLNPSLAQAHYNLGALYWTASRWTDAARELGRAAELEPRRGDWARQAALARARVR